MARTPDEIQAAAAHGAETWHGGLGGFHTKEAARYHAKADALQAAGKVKAAARARKVADRNTRLAAKHGEALQEP